MKEKIEKVKGKAKKLQKQHGMNQSKESKIKKE